MQKITQACYENRLGNYCSADNSKFGDDHHAGWKWGSNYNTTEGTQFAEKFLDDRELMNFDPSDHERHKKALIHLHNNGVGRSVSI